MPDLTVDYAGRRMTALTAVALVLTLVGAGLVVAGFFTREPPWKESAIVWNWVATLLWWRHQ